MSDTESTARTDHSSTRRGIPWSLVTKVLLAIVALALLILIGRRLGAYIPQFAEWVDSLGVWGSSSSLSATQSRQWHLSLDRC